MLMNKQQTCGFLGWTAYEFDKAVAKGFPAKKRNNSRGQDWQVDSREAVAWAVEQETAKVRPRGRATGKSGPPPGWQASKAVEAVADPVLGATMVTMLWAFYSVPRLTALAGSEIGLSVEQSFRMSGGVLLMLLKLCRARLEWWPKDPDASVLVDEYFEPINWPWLAEKAASPVGRRPSTFSAGSRRRPRSGPRVRGTAGSRRPAGPRRGAGGADA